MAATMSVPATPTDARSLSIQDLTTHVTAKRRSGDTRTIVSTVGGRKSAFRLPIDQENDQNGKTDGEVKPTVHPGLMLNNPHLNKGTAFTHVERTKLGLRGLLPASVETMEVQMRRSYQQFLRFSEPMAKYIYLASLRDRNDGLFYRMVIDRLEEFLPYIYTPTVGQACLEFGLQYRQAEGMYFNQDDRGHMRAMLDNWKANSDTEVSIIVVTDGSRILGLGDLGACGMGIPLGKLSLYVAAGGFHPATVLPVVLDTGTNNEGLLKDEFYLGKRHRRLGDAEYYPLMDELLGAIEDKWPGALLQFEDFSNDHCFRLLKEYRTKMLCFNDDIQGTGVTIAAGLLNALKLADMDSREAVQKLKFIFCGAGSAGTGVADQIRAVLTSKYGVPVAETYKFFYLMDSKGLVSTLRPDHAAMPDFKKPYARADMAEHVATIGELVELIKPHGLIGLCGMAGQFPEAVLTRMGELNERPIIFPLSNPTSKSECTFEQAVRCTQGRVIFASGSPFDDLVYQEKAFKASQGNNLYAFPGIGFGAWLCRATHVSDAMIESATIALSNTVSEVHLAKGLLYPPLQSVREVSAKIASAVILQAYAEGLARATDIPYHSLPDTINFVVRSMYNPVYQEWCR